MTVPATLARLTPAYLARLAAPTGLGDLVPADLAGEVGSVVGGGGVRVMVRLDRAGRVAATSFRSLGSAAAHGPGSVWVERARGATQLPEDMGPHRDVARGPGARDRDPQLVGPRCNLLGLDRVQSIEGGSHRPWICRPAFDDARHIVHGQQIVRNT